ncbi:MULTISPECIES: DMT family transporter [Pseudoalteromonas]|uniref:EamA family transporter n=1 Tax=Pseudoalteromonas distincta TaxID=77608 RepID=A0ABT9G9Q9_9GAMM|nr:MULTISPECIES: EamA family transporter [Pseudoalteromonas]KHM49889.1 membrane protein [Pseudoalteromonas elyakovii]KID40616.1 membrane protein [Pseudoalteromonas distincta]KPV93123.1 putative DMT superfamily transporter inner membrane protein [Pseudoalteromonas sp. P1-30]KPV98959.1 putative DMT superfamily transporter inner membrane protein [Pseudoalteromonas sp. P1-11]MDO6637456.1 EamA family transporter [Pseudoalteromonas carrageenovora]
MENHHGSFKGVMAIIVASFLWGTTGTAASYSPDVSSLAIGAFSMGIGGVLLVITARKKLLIDYKLMLEQPVVFLLGAVSVAIYPLVFYTSMRLSGVAIGTVVSIATAPFFAAILERLISKKDISLQWMLSFVIGAIGIALLTLGKDQSNNAYSINQQGLGILLGCIAGLTYAGYSWSARRLIESGIQSKSSMSGLFGCAALLLLPSLWFTGDNLFSSSTNAFVSLYMAIIPMFLGYLLFGFGLNYIDASKATLITLIEPLVATVLAIVIIGEKFKVIGWIGVALVSLCLLIQTIKPQKKIKISHQKI